MALAAAIWLAGAPARAEVPPDVKKIFGDNCKKCHGWDGKGQTGMGKKLKIVDFTAAGFQKKVDDKTIKKTILDGYEDPADPKRKMKAYKGEVSEAQAAELVKVIRAFAKTPGPFASEVK